MQEVRVQSPVRPIFLFFSRQISYKSTVFNMALSKFRPRRGRSSDFNDLILPSRQTGFRPLLYFTTGFRPLLYELFIKTGFRPLLFITSVFDGFQFIKLLLRRNLLQKRGQC